jgi:hypothetical protein
VVLDLAADDLHRPGAVGPLGRPHPLVGLLGGGALVADHERHRRLDVVPHVGVLPRRPRDRAGRLLHRRDRGRGLADLRGGQDALDVRDHHAGLVK